MSLNSCNSRPTTGMKFWLHTYLGWLCQATILLAAMFAIWFAVNFRKMLFKIFGRDKWDSGWNSLRSTVIGDDLSLVQLEPNSDTIPLPLWSRALEPYVSVRVAAEFLVDLRGVMSKPSSCPRPEVDFLEFSLNCISRVNGRSCKAM